VKKHRRVKEFNVLIEREAEGFYPCLEVGIP